MKKEKQLLVEEIRRLDIAQLTHEISMEMYKQCTADRVEACYRLSLEAIYLDILLNKGDDQTMNKCKHPPERLYSGFGKTPINGKLINVMWVCCCKCGKYIGDLKLPYQIDKTQRL